MCVLRLTALRKDDIAAVFKCQIISRRATSVGRDAGGQLLTSVDVFGVELKTSLLVFIKRNRDSTANFWESFNYSVPGLMPPEGSSIK